MRIVLKLVVAWVMRVATSYFAWLFAVATFANWRYFPSFDFAVPKYWSPLLFASILAGVFHLIPAMLLVAFLRAYRKAKSDWSIDVVYAALFVLTPLILEVLPRDENTIFSFGVSEGEIIHENIRTPLGWYYLWMTTAQSIYHMLIYLVLRFITQRCLTNHKIGRTIS